MDTNMDEIKLPRFVVEILADRINGLEIKLADAKYAASRVKDLERNVDYYQAQATSLQSRLDAAERLWVENIAKIADPSKYIEIAKSGKIPAIKALREDFAGLGLKAAKDLVDAWADEGKLSFPVYMRSDYSLNTPETAD